MENLIAKFQVGMLRVKRYLRSQKGQGMVEYALIIALVSIVAAVVLGALGGQVTATFQNIVNTLQGNP